MKAFLRELLTMLVTALIIFVGLQVVVEDYVIRESSMEPNFYDGQRILANKVVYKFHEPQRGDVIIFHPPSYRPDSDPFIKRIIALPGETVEIKNSSVYINGSKLDEPYIRESPHYTLQSEKVNDGYFVLGDNRNNSNDSHTGWIVPRQNLIGKAWLSFWPPNKWGLVTNYRLPAQIASPSGAK